MPAAGSLYPHRFADAPFLLMSLSIEDLPSEPSTSTTKNPESEPVAAAKFVAGFSPKNLMISAHEENGFLEL